MLTKKEVVWIIIAVLIMGLIISWSGKPWHIPELNYLPFGILIAFIIILTNVLVKKVAAPYYSIKIEHKIWHFQRMGWSKRAKLKKPFPIGLILPFYLAFTSAGVIKMMTLLQFKAENLLEKRVLKTRGTHRYSEINDSDLAFTSAWGFWALIALAIIGAILKQPELTKYSIYYGIWNLIPISNLDGTKLFFGSFINWVLLIIIYIISLIVILI